MSKFDLEKALAGEFVKLRNGQKALIYYCIPDEFVFDSGKPVLYPLRGMIFNENDEIKDFNACWKNNGKYNIKADDYDIVGMWETLEDIINTAYEKQLPVKLRDGRKAIIWSKAPDGYTYPDGSKPEYVYRGAILYSNEDNNPYLITEIISWLKNGHYLLSNEHTEDIIGIWKD